VILRHLEFATNYRTAELLARCVQQLVEQTA
jgi:hypothetical protein